MTRNFVLCLDSAYQVCPDFRLGSFLDELFGSNVVINKGTKDGVDCNIASVYLELPFVSLGIWMCYIKESKTLVFFTANILLMNNVTAS